MIFIVYYCDAMTKKDRLMVVVMMLMIVKVVFSWRCGQSMTWQGKREWKKVISWSLWSIYSSFTSSTSFLSYSHLICLASEPKDLSFSLFLSVCLCLSISYKSYNTVHLASLASLTAWREEERTWHGWQSAWLMRLLSSSKYPFLNFPLWLFLLVLFENRLCH